MSKIYLVSKDGNRSIAIDPDKKVTFIDKHTSPMNTWQERVETYTVTTISQPEKYYVESLINTQIQDENGTIFNTRKSLIACDMLML